MIFFSHREQRACFEGNKSKRNFARSLQESLCADASEHDLSRREQAFPILNYCGEIRASRKCWSCAATPRFFISGLCASPVAICASMRKQLGETWNSSLNALLKWAGLLNPHEYAISVIEFRECAGLRRSSRHRLSLIRRIDPETDVPSVRNTLCTYHLVQFKATAICSMDNWGSRR